MAALVVALCVPSGAAAADRPFTERCTAANERLETACLGLEQVSGQVNGSCRWVGAVDDERCPALLSPRVIRRRIDAYQDSWAHRALGLQYELGGDVPLRNAPWVGTHNSFNSTAEMGPTLSDTDANQQLSIVDQLRLDMRKIEIDLHWFPSAQPGGFGPVVCHAQEEDRAHLGCSIEKPLRVVLAEVAAWLRDRPDQVLLIQLEDDLGHTGFDQSAAAIERELGELVYRPAAAPGSCAKLPLDLTREDVRQAGKQVLLVSDCGQGAAWRGVVFDWGDLEQRPIGFTDFPRCGPDVTREQYETRQVRYYEDSTWLTAATAALGVAGSEADDGIDERTAAMMSRCGVDVLDFDQLLPADPRLRSVVWSWAPGEPRAGAGRCAIQRADARWSARGCRRRYRVACRAGDGTWLVTRRRVRARSAARRCARLGAQFAAPRTGYEGQLLKVAMERAGALSAWLGLVRRAGTWVALDRR